MLHNDSVGDFAGKNVTLHSVHPRPLLSVKCRGIEPPTKFLKRVGLTGPQLLQWGCWERNGDIFRRLAIFKKIKKLRYEIFNDIKSS